MCPIWGCVFVSWLHSFHQTPLTCPNWHVSGIRQVLQPVTKMRPHMGRVFMSTYICSPPEHYQHAHLGMLVFHSSTKACQLGMSWFSNGGDIPPIWICAVLGAPFYLACLIFFTILPYLAFFPVLLPF